MTIYFIKRESDGAIKVGYTKNTGERFTELRNQHGAIEVLGIMDGDYKLENSLHSQFAEHLIEGREWFSDCTAIREYIATNTKQATEEDQRRYALSIKPVTLTAINLIASDPDLSMGKKLSGNQALWALICQHRPDIAERAKAIAASRTPTHLATRKD